MEEDRTYLLSRVKSLNSGNVSQCLWLVDRPGWCSPWKDCCWMCLRLTFRQPVWKSFSKSLSDRSDVFIVSWRKAVFYSLVNVKINTNCQHEDFHTGCREVSHNQQQSFSGLHQPGQSTSHKHIYLLIYTLYPAFTTSSQIICSGCAEWHVY